MTAAQMVLTPVGGIDGRRVSPVAAFWNLFVKEFRESRSALIVGVFAFWLMPVFLGLVALAVNRGEALQVFGTLVYMLLLSGGWLFAAAFGANIVCRDWGRSEEHFLLAQPVTPRWVVGAKLAAAIAVIGLIVLILLGIMHLLMLVGVDAARREYLWGADALVLCLIGVSLVLSFSIAVITRQTSASLVLTMLIVALGVAAPLVSTRFSFLHPDWDELSRIPGLRGEHRPTLLESWHAYASFLASLVVCVAGSLTAAFVLCTRERAIRIGHKPLAWTVALAALLLFGAGMMEVGRSADICDRVLLCRPGLNRADAVLNYGRDGGYAVCSWENTHLHVAAFDVGSDGRIGSLRSGEVRLDAIRLPQEFGGDAFPAPSMFDELERSGELAFKITGLVSHFRLLGKYGLSRLETRWSEKAGFELVSASIAGEAADPHAPGSQWWLYSRASTDRYAYLVYEEDAKRQPDSPNEDNTDTPRRNVLRVYDWSARPRPAKVLEMPLPTRCQVRCRDSKLLLLDPRLSSLVGEVPLDDLQAIKDLFAGGIPQRRMLSSTERIALADYRGRRGWNSGARFERDGMEYQLESDSKGLLVWRTLDANRMLGPFRSYRSSPLGRMLFDRGGGLQVVDPTLLAEQGPRTIVFYDMSDLDRMRRVGFYNTSGTWMALVEEADSHLLVLERGELTVLKRPKTARAGTATLSEAAPAQAGGG